jgi:hypothetical protein
MDKKLIEELETLMHTANLIEQCQTLCLISSNDRSNYFSLLNDKVHVAIAELLKS